MYKLIKKYPGSPKLGTLSWREGNKTIFQYAKGVFSYSTLDPEYTEFPEYWEKYVEKGFEILSFIKDCVILHKNYAGNIYADTADLTRYTIYDLLEDEQVKIYSVKRVSDGEVFTIGDKIDFVSVNEYKGYIIQDIRFGFRDSNKIYFNLVKGGARSGDTYSGLALEYAEKAKKPLFTTEDGYDVNVGTKYWFVRHDFSIGSGTARKNEVSSKDSGNAYRADFMILGAAEEYVLMNKPCLSINDIINSFDGYKYVTKEVIIKKLAKLKV